VSSSSPLEALEGKLSVAISWNPNVLADGYLVARVNLPIDELLADVADVPSSIFSG
jgi:hypothetical protein